VPLPGKTVPADVRALPKGLLFFFVIVLMRVVVLKGGGGKVKRSIPWER
jgi:hypothetical protein